MDALSKIFDDIHLAKSKYVYLQLNVTQGFQYYHEPSMLAYVVISGEVQLMLPNKNHELLQQGDLILLTSSSSHQITYPDTQPNLLNLNQIFDDQTTILWDSLTDIAFHSADAVVLSIRAKLDEHMARPLLNALPDMLYIQHITAETAPEWLRIGLQFLANETRLHQPGRDKILDHLVSILFIECVRDHIVKLNDADNWLKALNHPELSNALGAIHASPDYAWTVESLAERCCMSRSKFALLFNQIVGETPLAYLQQHRLRLAAQYLRDTALSVQQIAHQVGYSSETAFSQSFKKQFQQTPTQYRSLIQNKSAS